MKKECREEKDLSAFFFLLSISIAPATTLFIFSTRTTFAFLLLPFDFRCTRHHQSQLIHWCAWLDDADDFAFVHHGDAV